MNHKAKIAPSSLDGQHNRSRNRRRLLQSLVALPFSGMLVHLTGALSEISAPPTMVPPMWATNGQTLIRIATAYLGQHPQWHEQGRMNDWIATFFDSASEQSATSILSKQIEADFQNGDYLLLDGWVISFTEARLCAYLSMTDGLPA